MNTSSAKKIMWLSPMCCLDRRSGAACQMRSVLTTLASAGWEAYAVHMTLCDGQEQYPISTIIGKKYAVPENYGQTLNFKRDGVEHHLFYTQSSYGRDLTREEAQTFYNRARKILEKIQPDVVLTYGSSQLCKALIRTARQNCRTLIFYLANPSYDDPELFRPFDQVLVPSNFQSEYYRDRLGIRSDVLRTLLPETSQISPREVLSTQAPELRRCGFITMINPSLAKGATLYARLVQMALQERPDLLFLAVEGRMTNEQWAQAGVDLANMSNIWWIPNQQDVRTIYARTSILLFPSYWNEASGRSIAEAQLGGIPVLGSNHAGIPEQLNGGGFLFDIPERCRERYTKVPGSDEIRPWLDTIYRLMDDEDFYRQTVQRALECGAMFDRKVVQEDVVQRFEAYAEGRDLRQPLQAGQETIVQETIAKGPKAGRNEPCPCGSGRKVKKCCGVEQASRMLYQESTSDQLQGAEQVDFEAAEPCGADQGRALELTWADSEPAAVQDEVHDQSWQSADCRHNNWLLQMPAGLKLSVPASLQVLTGYVFLEQEQWFEPETALVLNILQPGMQVLDIGACFGVYTLPMSRAVHSSSEPGQVYAFEPGALAREHLQASLQENNLSNVQVYAQGLAAIQGRARLQREDSPELNRIDKGQAALPGEDIELNTLDDWWVEAGRPDIDFIKLDVNGHETFVLQGGAEFLEQTSPVILVSIRIKGALNRATLLLLGELGYELFQYIPGPGLLVRYDQEATPEPYLLNLIACRPEQAAKLQEQGLLAPEELEVPEPEAGFWQEYLASLPWTAPIQADWQEQHLNTQDTLHQNYLRALDFLCAAQDPDAQPAQKLAQTQWAIQNMIPVYQACQDSASVALSLVRAMQGLGLSQQSVQILQDLQNQLQSSRQPDFALPCLAPLKELDMLQTERCPEDWVRARCTEALVMLRSYSGWFSAQRDLELLQGLEGNPECSIYYERRLILCTLHTGRSIQIQPGSSLLAPEQQNSEIWQELAGPGQGSAAAVGPVEQGSEAEQNLSGLNQQSKIRRNDPCPCGSGKKAKNCCGVGSRQMQEVGSSVVQ